MLSDISLLETMDHAYLATFRYLVRFNFISIFLLQKKQI